MPKVSTASVEEQPGLAHRHKSLYQEYAADGLVRQKPGRKRKLSDGEQESSNYIDTKASRKILQIGQELVNEDQLERKASAPNAAFEPHSRLDDTTHDAPIIEEDDEDAWADDDGVVEDIDMDPNDQDIFNRFHPSRDADPANLFDPAEDDEAQNEEEGVNLTELILQKIAAHEALSTSDNSADPSRHRRQDSPMDEVPLDPKVLEVYTKVGQILSRYRSGKLPKPFKILPTLSASEIPLVISVTKPEGWTPHALKAATRLFISSKPVVAQPFLHTILLPRVREDIHEHKKLNLHLYEALMKSLYKPACFFKGILFPLLEDGTCTLREADIISSILAKKSVPVLHSAAALLRLCDIAAEQFSTSKEDGGGGATNIFIRTLLQKKYALPYRVVDALVFHFIRFKAINSGTGEDDVTMGDMDGIPKAGSRRLPVLWHQCFLAFSQRYRNDITEDQREALLDLINAVGHKGIGPEIRRELLEGRGRGVPAPADGTSFDGDDTMMG